MLEEELLTLIETIQRRGCEGQTTEVKAAAKGCPEKLYDTMSSFSNQDDGGVFVFGLDETQHFEAVGVYNAQDLQKRVMEQGEQMTPVVRPIFTVCDRDGKVFVSAEIAPVDLAERPCYKTTKGRLKGSYKRVGEADKPMTEYEVYSYEAYRKRYREDAREAAGATLGFLVTGDVDSYIARMRSERPNLAATSEAQQLELCGITNRGQITLSALLLFGVYPQSLYPRLCIAAARIPGENKGTTDEQGNRFSDSESIIGTLPDMLERAMDFVRRNTRIAIGINPNTGQRRETPEYPPEAVREAILNALVHRDYSRYNEDKPIRLEMYDDRLEIINPGGLYGKTTIEQLGHTQPDTRNTLLVTMMERIGKTENRYSGIPTIRNLMSRAGLPEPRFESSKDEFRVTLFNKRESSTPPYIPSTAPNDDRGNLLAFCRTPRTRTEIAAYLGIASVQYAMRRYIVPLIESGAVRMTHPESPRSRSQRYVTVEMQGRPRT